ncbi:cupin domain-containing protein [Pseudorhodobacter sp. W20_MBD10_FR17]|uniref:cupin domain-containing protein n=1 Tax=Pseudorhodobacter sp. W20_MBD10_FR17 TaxID=3240266 RepID=UPI003F98994F
MDALYYYDVSALGEPEVGSPLAERIIDGAPTNKTWEIEGTPDGTVSTGIWEVQVGSWHVVKETWEVCTIIEGESELIEEGKAPRRITLGDSFIMRPGHTYVWNVITPTKKIYVIRENV